MGTVGSGLALSTLGIVIEVVCMDVTREGGNSLFIGT